MWIALYDWGVSQPYFCRSKLVAANTGIFINRCLQPKLLPFINLAGEHYSNEIVTWMKENLHFGEKALNSRNVLQAMPIQKLWSIFAQQVYE